MSVWHVTGGNPLRGSVRAQGSKNAVLPVIAAALLCGNETELSNCPHLSDVEVAMDILRHLGCGASLDGDILTLDTGEIEKIPVHFKGIRSIQGFHRRATGENAHGTRAFHGLDQRLTPLVIDMLHSEIPRFC